MATPSELSDAAVEAGINPSAVLKWANDPEVLRNPEYQVMPAAQMVQKFQQAGTLLQQANSGKIDLNALSQVTVSGKRPPIPTTVNPYRGTNQEKAAGEDGNANASAINQFDPAAMEAAQAKYNQYYKDQSLGRGVTGFLAGFGGGTAGVTADRQAWEAKNKEMLDQTVGAQERKQTQATAGQAALTSAQQREESAGKFEGTQREQQQKLDIGQFTVEQQRRLNDANSPETTSLKAVIPSILARADISQEGKEALIKIAKDPKATATQLAPIIATLAPATMKAWQDSITGRKGEAEVRTKTAEADIGEAVRDALLKKPGQTGQAPNADISNGDNSPEAQRRRAATDLAAIDREIANTPKTETGRLQILNQEKLKIQSKALALGAPSGGQSELEKRLPFSSISGAGQTLNPDPRIVAGATNEAGQAADAEKRFRTYDTELAPTLSALRQKLESAGTGKGTALISAYLPGNETQEVVNLLNRANTMYPGVLSNIAGSQMAGEIAKGGFNGNLVGAMTTDQVRNAIQLIERTQAADRTRQQEMNKSSATGATPGQFNTNQPMPNTTPKSPTGVPTIRTKEDYDKLKSGDVYIDSRDGQQKRKK